MASVSVQSIPCQGLPADSTKVKLKNLTRPLALGICSAQKDHAQTHGFYTEQVVYPSTKNISRAGS